MLVYPRDLCYYGGPYISRNWICFTVLVGDSEGVITRLKAIRFRKKSIDQASKELCIFEINVGCVGFKGEVVTREEFFRILPWLEEEFDQSEEFRYYPVERNLHQDFHKASEGHFLMQ